MLNPAEEGSFPGICVNMSLGGACFRTQREVEPGTLVRIEAPDALWLGEVVYCRKETDCCFIGTHFEHSLIGLSQLQRTLQRLEWNPQTDPKPSGRV